MFEAGFAFYHGLFRDPRVVRGGRMFNRRQQARMAHDRGHVGEDAIVLPPGLVLEAANPPTFSTTELDTARERYELLITSILGTPPAPVEKKKSGKGGGFGPSQALVEEAEKERSSVFEALRGRLRELHAQWYGVTLGAFELKRLNRFVEAMDEVDQADLVNMLNPPARPVRAARGLREKKRRDVAQALGVRPRANPPTIAELHGLVADRMAAQTRMEVVMVWSVSCLNLTPTPRFSKRSWRRRRRMRTGAKWTHSIPSSLNGRRGY